MIVPLIPALVSNIDLPSQAADASRQYHEIELELAKPEPLPGKTLRAGIGLSGRNAAELLARKSASKLNGHEMGAMLVLSRKLHQKIVIDDRIEITVNRIRGNNVKLYVYAPGERIGRGEYSGQANPQAEPAGFGRGGLVLTRKPGQTILIGDNISIKVLNVKGDNVRLGIDAPPEIPVHRSEIQERIERERG